jgi:hypothetical protein
MLAIIVYNYDGGFWQISPGDFYRSYNPMELGDSNDIRYDVITSFINYHIKLAIVV